MSIKKVLQLIYMGVALLLFHANASAQSVGLSDVTIDVEGCDGQTHSFGVAVLDIDSYPLVTYRITIDGDSRIFVLDLDKANDYEIIGGELVYNDPTWNSYINFYLEGLGCAFSSGTISDAVVPFDPVVSQSVQSFKAVVFSERAQPRAAGKREKKTQKAREEEQRKEGGTPGPAVPRLYGLASSDIEREWFSISSLDGTNLAIRGGYAKTSDDGVYTYGGNYILNNLSIEGSSSSNSTINLNGNKILLETEDRERTVGASANILLFENDNGIALAAYGVERKYDGDKIIVYGGMFQYSKVGDLSSGYLMAAGMYGFPLANEKFSLNIDGLFVRNLFLSFDGESVDLDSKNILDLGASLEDHLGRLGGYG
ncbi:MAG: hypothetical protein IH972_02300 [Candidatus Marinimicrobia bacterium]|nr:hypothetical protein [Candidatus Neomarinimicrobiota bacterium]